MADLQKRLGLVQLVALGAAGVVGTSWIYTNGKFFAKYGAGGEIFGLMAAAVLCSFIAMAYAQMASTIPRAGGEVVYAYSAFNRTTGFAAGWLLAGAFISSLAFYVTAFGTLLLKIFPGMATAPLFTINAEPVYLPVLAVGVGLALVIFALNWFGLSFGVSLQIVLFGAMLLIGAALVVTGFVHGTAANFFPPFAEGSNAAGSIVRFILPGMTFLTGFGLVAIMAEDAKIAHRKIGIAVVTSVLVAAGFYVLVLTSSAWVIPWEQTAKLPQGTIDAFQTAGFTVLGWGAYSIAVLGLLTSFLALFLATSRILIAMGRSGLLPAGLGKINQKRSTPGPALIFTLAVTLGLGWLGKGAMIWFLDAGGVFIGLAWTLGVASMYRLDRRFPGLEVGYRARPRWLPAVGAVGAVFVIAFALWPGTDLSLVWPQEYLILGVWLLLGVVMYVFAGQHRDAEPRRQLLGEYYDKMFDDNGRPLGSANRPVSELKEDARSA